MEMAMAMVLLVDMVVVAMADLRDSPVVPPRFLTATVPTVVSLRITAMEAHP